MSLALGSRRILACRDTLAAAMLTRFADLHPLPASEGGVNAIGLPAGISVEQSISTPELAQALDMDHLPALHASALGQAWRDGAWDVRVHLVPPLAGSQIGMITSHVDYSACGPQVLDLLVRAAGAGRLASWSWRPICGAPAIRFKAWAGRDTTLRPDGGRDGAPPALAAPNFAWRKHRDWIIQLGRAPEGDPAVPIGATASRGPRATPRQRACIVALRRETGRDVGAPLPGRLTRAEASAMIDALRAA